MFHDRIICIEPGAKAVKVQNWMRKYFLVDWETIISKAFPKQRSEQLEAAYG